MLLEISQFTETITEVFLPCNKCQGKGVLPQHRRIQGGVCFKCDGQGTSNKTRTIVKETEQTYVTEVQIMDENDSFDSIFEAYQNKKAKIESPDFNIFDWFDGAYD